MQRPKHSLIPALLIVGLLAAAPPHGVSTVVGVVFEIEVMVRSVTDSNWTGIVARARSLPEAAWGEEGDPGKASDWLTVPRGREITATLGFKGSDEELQAVLERGLGATATVRGTCESLQLAMVQLPGERAWREATVEYRDGRALIGILTRAGVECGPARAPDAE